MRAVSSLSLDFFNWCLLGVVAAVLAFQLAVPPIIGVGDNGDWYRIMIPAGFEHLPNPPPDARFFVNKTAFTRPNYHQLPYGFTSGTLVALVARAIGPILSSDGLFYIPIIGLLNSLVLLLGMGLILYGTQAMARLPRRVLGILLAIIFTDAGYVAFFNSFYTQTASLLFLLVTAGCFVMVLRSSGREPLWFAAFTVSSLFYVTSKPQEAPQALLLGALAIISARMIPLHRPWASGIGVAVVIVAVAVIVALPQQKSLHNQCLYNQVFDDLLRYSPDARDDLRALDLSEDLIRYQSHHAFEPETPIRTPEFQTAFFARVGYKDVIRFYLSRPVRLWELLSRRARYAFTLVTTYGNYDKSAGRREGAQTKSFKFWSSFKRTVFPGSMWTLIVLFGIHTAGMAILWRRGPQSNRFKLGILGFAILNLMAIGAFLTCAFLDGTLDIVRQLYAFNVMIDGMLIIDAIICWYALSHWWQRPNRLA